MGAKISVSNTPARFQAAEIKSRYFMSVMAPCEVVKVDSDSDRNDDFEGAHTIKIDMSDYDRSNATGSILDGLNISVKFPDDQTCTGQLQAPNRIQWSNGSTWTKRP